MTVEKALMLNEQIVSILKTQFPNLTAEKVTSIAREIVTMIDKVGIN